MPLRYVLIILFIIIAPLSYFFVIQTKNSVLAEMIDAAQRSDDKAIAARIDWDRLRNFLKDDIRANKGGGIYTANFGPSLAQIPVVVDHYIQPENIAVAFYFRDQMFKGVLPEDFIESSGFAPPFGFYVALAYPKVAPGNPAPEMRALRDRLQVRFVFRLSGAAWKIREMHIPLFMVPSQPNPLPDLKTLPKP